jgi:hypothetical protein
MEKRYITVVFEYEPDADLPKELTRCAASPVVQDGEG